MRYPKIVTFFHPFLACEHKADLNYSKSPAKPARLMAYLATKGLADCLEIRDDFPLLEDKDFHLAHTATYVEDFFSGKGLCESNNLRWSHEFATSVRYTNSSLWAALRNSLCHPAEVSFSPTSGFHHATPERGGGFCTFSGQVIASLKAWESFAAVGCYIDLDAHFGNSIEDSRRFAPDLDQAVPKAYHFNGSQTDGEYFAMLETFVRGTLEPALLAGSVQYVVWCHGADSHRDDQLGHQCTTRWWLRCADFFWSWIAEMDAAQGRPVPVSCALFGGYRDDHYNSVLSLHTGDLMSCMRHLLGWDSGYQTEVRARKSM